jgi:histidine triad (HIT) family protein
VGDEQSCIFCRIARREIPATVVHEDEDVVAFRDLNPQAPTHVLVIPKRHVAKLADATDADAPAIGRALAAVGRVARELGLTDYRVVANNGERAGQSVFHIHFHLLGGRAFTWPPG